VCNWDTCETSARHPGRSRSSLVAAASEAPLRAPDPADGAGETPGPEHTEEALREALEEEVSKLIQDPDEEVAAFIPEVPANLRALAAQREAAVWQGAAASAEVLDGARSSIPGLATDAPAGWECPASCAPLQGMKPPDHIGRRRTMWEAAAACFHPRALVDPQIPVGTAHLLQIVWDTMGAWLLSARPSDAMSYRNPPPELFERITGAEFIEQYRNLRTQVIPQLLRQVGPDGCLEVVRVQLRLETGRVLVLPVEEVVFDSQGRSISELIGNPATISAELEGHPHAGASGVIEHLTSQVHEAGLYRLLMTMPYARVRATRIWHVLRVYHRLVMAGGTTEALAESVCSALTRQVHGCLGQRPLGDLIAAVKLRDAGVRGSGGDEAFLERALEIYFKGKPWHVFLTERARREKRARESLSAEAAPAKWGFVRGALRPFAAASARKHLKVTPDVGAGTAEARAELARNPKAGLLLRGMRGAKESQAALGELIRASTPDALDVGLAHLALSRHGDGASSSGARAGSRA